MATSTPDSICPTAGTAVEKNAIRPDIWHEGQGGLLFACPFYKFNPVEYDECKRFKFKQITHLKQHIERRHSLPRYSCTICWREFNNEQSRTGHLRNDKCQPKPQPEKLSIDEVEKMKRCTRGTKLKHSRKGDSTEHPRRADSRHHWQVVWSQLFPGFTAPSPYVHSNQFEEIKDRIWPGIAKAIDASHSSLLQNDKSQMDLPSFFRSTMDSAYQSFLHSLPKSRHTQPSIVHENPRGDANAAPTIAPLPSVGDNRVVSSMGSELNLDESTIFNTEEYEDLFIFGDHAGVGVGF